MASQNKSSKSTSAPVVSTPAPETESRGPGRRSLAETVQPIAVELLTAAGTEHPIDSDLVSSVEKACRSRKVKATFAGIAQVLQKMKESKMVRTYSDKDDPNLTRVCRAEDFPL